MQLSLLGQQIKTIHSKDSFLIYTTEMGLDIFIEVSGEKQAWASLSNTTCSVSVANGVIVGTTTGLFLVPFSGIETGDLTLQIESLSNLELTSTHILDLASNGLVIAIASISGIDLFSMALSNRRYMLYSGGCFQLALTDAELSFITQDTNKVFKILLPYKNWTEHDCQVVNNKNAKFSFNESSLPIKPTSALVNGGTSAGKPVWWNNILFVPTNNGINVFIRQSNVLNFLYKQSPPVQAVSVAILNNTLVACSLRMVYLYNIEVDYSLTFISSILAIPETVGSIKNVVFSAAKIVASITFSPYIRYFNLVNNELVVEPIQISFSSSTRTALKNEFLIVGTAGTTELQVYKFSDNTIEFLINLPNLPGAVADLQWCGDYLIITHTGAPYAVIYRRVNNDFLSIPINGTIRTTVSKLAVAKNSVYVTFLHSASPHISWGQLTTTELTMLAPPEALLNTAAGCAWSDDGVYFVYCMNTTPFTRFYKRSGTTLTQITSPTGLTNSAADVASSGVYFSFIQTTSPTIRHYKLVTDTLTALTNPTATATFGNLSWTDDILAARVSATGTTQAFLYKRTGDTIASLRTITTLGYCMRLEWCDNYLIATSNTFYPFLFIWERPVGTDSTTKVVFIVDDPVNIFQNTNSNGYLLTNFSANSAQAFIVDTTTHLITSYVSDLAFDFSTVIWLDYDYFIAIPSSSNRPGRIFNVNLQGKINLYLDSLAIAAIERHAAVMIGSYLVGSSLGSTRIFLWENNTFTDITSTLVTDRIVIEQSDTFSATSSGYLAFLSVNLAEIYLYQLTPDKLITLNGIRQPSHVAVNNSYIALRGVSPFAYAYRYTGSELTRLNIISPPTDSLAVITWKGTYLLCGSSVSATPSAFVYELITDQLVPITVTGLTLPVYSLDINGIFLVVAHYSSLALLKLVSGEFVVVHQLSEGFNNTKILFKDNYVILHTATNFRFYKIVADSLVFLTQFSSGGGGYVNSLMLYKDYIVATTKHLWFFKINVIDDTVEGFRNSSINFDANIALINRNNNYLIHLGTSFSYIDIIDSANTAVVLKLDLDSEIDLSGIKTLAADGDLWVSTMEGSTTFKLHTASYTPEEHFLTSNKLINSKDSFFLLSNSIYTVLESGLVKQIYAPIQGAIKDGYCLTNLPGDKTIFAITVQTTEGTDFFAFVNSYYNKLVYTKPITNAAVSALWFDNLGLSFAIDNNLTIRNKVEAVSSEAYTTSFVDTTGQYWIFASQYEVADFIRLLAISFLEGDISLQRNCTSDLSVDSDVSAVDASLVRSIAANNISKSLVSSDLLMAKINTQLANTVFAKFLSSELLLIGTQTSLVSISMPAMTILAWADISNITCIDFDNDYIFIGTASAGVLRSEVINFLSAGDKTSLVVSFLTTTAIQSNVIRDLECNALKGLLIVSDTGADYIPSYLSTGVVHSYIDSQLQYAALGTERLAVSKNNVVYYQSLPTGVWALDLSKVSGTQAWFTYREGIATPRTGTAVCVHETRLAVWQTEPDRITIFDLTTSPPTFIQDIEEPRVPYVLVAWQDCIVAGIAIEEYSTGMHVYRWTGSTYSFLYSYATHFNSRYPALTVSPDDTKLIGMSDGISSPHTLTLFTKSGTSISAYNQTTGDWGSTAVRACIWINNTQCLIAQESSTPSTLKILQLSGTSFSTVYTISASLFPSTSGFSYFAAFGDYLVLVPSGSPEGTRRRLYFCKFIDSTFTIEKYIVLPAISFLLSYKDKLLVKSTDLQTCLVFKLVNNKIEAAADLQISGTVTFSYGNSLNYTCLSLTDDYFIHTIAQQVQVYSITAADEGISVDYNAVNKIVYERDLFVATDIGLFVHGEKMMARRHFGADYTGPETNIVAIRPTQFAHSIGGGVAFGTKSPSQSGRVGLINLED